MRFVATIALLAATARANVWLIADRNEDWSWQCGTELCSGLRTDSRAWECDNNRNNCQERAFATNINARANVNFDRGYYTQRDGTGTKLFRSDGQHLHCGQDEYYHSDQRIFTVWFSCTNTAWHA